MKRSRFQIFIMIVAVSAALCSCGEEEIVPKSSFGQIDAMQDGEILLDQEAPDDTDDATEGGAGSVISSGKPMKTAKQLDVDELPDELKAMAAMCDAINLTSVELRKTYGEADDNFVWHSVHMFVVNNMGIKYGFKKVADNADAEPRTISNLIFAMFGKLREIPPLTDVSPNGNDGRAHILISNGMKYRFTMEDRGKSTPAIRRVTEYSDGSVEMEVALVDSNTGEETVSFIYTMRVNTRDTTTSAMFGYEITGARAADGITSDKLAGTPYLAVARRIYGRKGADKNDPASAVIEEVLKFVSFDENVPGLAYLNNAIDEDIIAYADDPPVGELYHEIMSYPLTTDDYVQVAVTLQSYPAYAKDPDIRCYGFDKKKKRPLEDTDLKALCGLTKDQVEDRIRNLIEPGEDGGQIQDIKYKGFLIRRNGSVDVFCTIDVTGGEGEPYSRLMAYNSVSALTRYVFEDDVIPADEADKIEPVLLHGRKD